MFVSRFVPHFSCSAVSLKRCRSLCCRLGRNRLRSVERPPQEIPIAPLIESEHFHYYPAEKRDCMLKHVTKLIVVSPCATQRAAVSKTVRRATGDGAAGRSAGQVRSPSGIFVGARPPAHPHVRAHRKVITVGQIKPINTGDT